MISASKVFVAFGPGAVVRFGTGMCANVRGQSGRRGEGGFAAVPVAFPRLGGRIVGHFVNFETRRIGEGGVATWPSASMFF